jgi:hypothetical protein
MATVSNQTSQVFTVENRGIFNIKHGRNINDVQTTTSVQKLSVEKKDLFGNTPNVNNNTLDRTPDVAVFPRGSRPNILLPPQVFDIEIFTFYS